MATSDEQSAALVQEESAVTRAEVAALREDLVRARGEAAGAKADRQLLREANERLVLANARSQELVDDAIEELRKAETRARELEKAADELREAAAVRERLIGMVSHDLRNPLSAIRVGAQLVLRHHRDDPEDTALIHRISRCAERMGTIIAQLLDFTRLSQGGGLPLEPSPANLMNLCQHVVEELELRHSAPGRFHCSFQGDLNGTWDTARIEQVIANLGGNAIEHGAKAAPIVVRACEAGEDVLLEVTNQGSPIPVDLLPLVFAAFSRGAQGEASPNDGLGLGLYISEAIVKAHGGSIAVRSTAGEGTTFSVRLPRSPPVELTDKRSG